ncbi:MAG: hypothetical protein JW786_00050 [Desulfobacterales bacterium]|nr:hypothetical protein [Desulfobacterales bacterium]
MEYIKIKRSLPGNRWKSESEFNEYIGKFAIQFEQVTWRMLDCIHGILAMNGLTNLKIHRVILSNYSARELWGLLRNLIGEVLVQREEDKASLKIVFNQIESLIKSRNNVLHSQWDLIGEMEYSNKEKEIIIVGKKYCADKKGAGDELKGLPKMELVRLLNECIDMCKKLQLLSRCILKIRTLEECFSNKNGSLVCNWNMLKPIAIKAHRVDLKKKR